MWKYHIAAWNPYLQDVPRKMGGRGLGKNAKLAFSHGSISEPRGAKKSRANNKATSNTRRQNDKQRKTKIASGSWPARLLGFSSEVFAFNSAEVFGFPSAEVLALSSADAFGFSSAEVLGFSFEV